MGIVNYYRTDLVSEEDRQLKLYCNKHGTIDGTVKVKDRAPPI